MVLYNLRKNPKPKVRFELDQGYYECMIKGIEGRPIRKRYTRRIIVQPICLCCRNTDQPIKKSTRHTADQVTKAKSTNLIQEANKDSVNRPNLIQNDLFVSVPVLSVAYIRRARKSRRHQVLNKKHKAQAQAQKSASAEATANKSEESQQHQEFLLQDVQISTAMENVKEEITQGCQRHSYNLRQSLSRRRRPRRFVSATPTTLDLDCIPMDFPIITEQQAVASLATLTLKMPEQPAPTTMAELNKKQKSKPKPQEVKSEIEIYLKGIEDRFVPKRPSRRSGGFGRRRHKGKPGKFTKNSNKVNCLSVS